MSTANKPFGAGGGSSPQNPSSDTFADAISAFRDIEALLGGGGDSVDLPLREMLKLMPADYVTVTNPEEAPDIKVSVKIDDVFYQLSKGKVALTASQLAASLPPEFIRPQALDDDHMSIKLPLPLIVASIDPQLLKDRTAIKTSRHKAMDMPDPFARKQAPAPVPTLAPAAPILPAVPPTVAAITPPTPVPLPVAETPPPVPTPIIQPTPPAITPPPVVEEPEPITVPAPEPPATEPLPVIAQEPEPATERPAQDEIGTPPPEPEPPVAEEESLPTPALEEAAQPEEPLAIAALEAAPEPAEEPAAIEEPLPEPELVAAAVEPPPPAPTPRRRPAPRPEAERVPIDEGDTFGGINLNTATSEQMLTLDGVTPAVAEAILQYREQHGPFSSIFDIQDIPRVGRVTFRKMTGMPHSKSHLHRRWKLARLLDIPVEQSGSLPAVARALAGKTGFSGCVISDKDGLLLAESGATPFAETVSAVTPRFMLLVDENARLLNLGTLDSVSLCLGDHMLTTVSCGKACLTAIHLRNKLTKAQLTLVRKVAAELGWLFSHRAYVGR